MADPTRAKQELLESRNNRFTKLSELRRFDPKKESMIKAASKVNEAYDYSFRGSIPEELEAEFGEILGGFTTSCPSAAFAYEMRRRGYDVEGGATGGCQDWDFETMFNLKDGAVSVDAKNQGCPPRTNAEVEQSMRDMGPGARGFCIYEWEHGRGGHVANFEIDANGEIVYIDAQIGTIFSDRLDFYPAGADAFYVQRMDDQTINEEAAAEWVRSDDGRVTDETDEEIKARRDKVFQQLIDAALAEGINNRRGRINERKEDRDEARLTKQERSLISNKGKNKYTYY